MSNALNWFEIPVTDFNRAKSFYETLLGTSLETLVMEPFTMGMLPAAPDGVGGAIVHGGDGSMPSSNGTLIYLNGGGDLSQMLSRVEDAGGTVLVPKSEIGNGFGFFAHFLVCCPVNT